MNAAVLVEQALQALAAGLLVGCVYGLLCVGLAFIFGIMRVINFAQGDFMMVGMYLAFWLATHVLGNGMFGAATPFVAAALTVPVLFAAGAALHRLLIARTTGLRAAGLSAEGHQAQLILTLGMALVLQNGGLLLLGSSPYSIVTPLSSSAWELPLLYDDFSAVFVNHARAIAAVLSLAVAFGLFRLVGSTRLGKSLRAAADNPEAATYMGIDVDRAHRIAFAIGTAVAGLAGGFIVTYYPVQPFVGVDFIIIMYAGVVLGGMGSITGAFWGGMVIGLVQQLSTLVLPLQLQNAAIFAAFVLILLFRPQGLFGRNVERA
ncbi:branched-chain amino acid ABC transporter permease [Falsiroseomonas sp. CW058]|uniref:branched-chain amino acid ABC transporter permease n=1 Tax=Falsiroseomonas sp. CW058 TaxID=3388664 RepID=UPI003D310B7C